MDQGWGLVRSASMTPAKTADKAYSKKALSKGLRQRGIKPRIAYRRHKTEPVLGRWKKRRNDLIARLRAPVEGVFSQLKRLHGMARARCHTLARNQGRALAALTAFNLKRAAKLVYA